jgi:hypothetical protein
MSSMRNTKSAEFVLAQFAAASAEAAWPRCKYPVGDGANLVQLLSMIVTIAVFNLKRR